MAWLLLRTSPVQTWLAKKYAARLSKDLNTRVSLKGVSISLFNNLSLEGLYIEDRQHDTLLYAGKTSVRITDWFFFKDRADLHYIGLENAVISTTRTDTVWNYQFLIDHFGGGGGGGKKKGIEFHLKEVDLKNISFRQHDEWQGEDLAAQVKTLHLEAEEINFNTKKALITSLLVDRPVVIVSNFPRKKPVSTGSLPAKPDSGLRMNKGDWNLAINEIEIRKGIFQHDKKTDREPFAYFDGKHMRFTDIDINLLNFTLVKDTMQAAMKLSTRERSGLYITSMKANARVTPQIMEFSKLDLNTPNSRLTDYFAMRYDSFNNDMADFIRQVKMEGRFKESEIESDDIALFAPALTNWKKKITLSGNVRGTVDNLSAKGMIVQAGRNTVLNGDITMAGLPDIDQTFIDFKANDFRTTYADAVSLVPQIAKIRQPAVNRISYLQFKGSYTGFIRDFVTFGTITTNLGTLVTDLNMKLPKGQIASYSGKINTGNFRLGEFIGVPDLGILSFNGTVKGKGFNMKDLNADVDGIVNELQYRGYSYKNISTKVNLNNKVFEGIVIGKDPNADFTLGGKVNFQNAIPVFDVNADVTRANLHGLGLTNDFFTIAGKFKLNFEGKTIDDFLGEAGITGASIFQNEKRLSFDSLHLRSFYANGEKNLSFSSNEFDGFIRGQFNVQDLPNAFQLFLNKYYPAYVKAPARPPKNENFSFEVNLGNVEDYIRLLDKDLGGFNQSRITGAINSLENSFMLDARIPGISYKQYRGDDIFLSGQGGLKNLVLKTKIGNIQLNDDLSFPETEINISSESDTSEISVKTRANQTLNAANLLATVITRQNGLRILFKPSTFDLNGNTWTLEENGELELSNDVLSSSKVRFTHADQALTISTEPSGEGYGNDIVTRITNINLGDFMPFITPKIRMDGKASGDITIRDPFGKLDADLDLDVEQFWYEKDSIGVVKLFGNYNKQSQLATFKVESDNEKYNFTSNGKIDLTNPAKPVLDINTQANTMPLSFLEQFLGNIFTDMTGSAEGGLQLLGDPKNIKFIGDLKLKKAGLKVKYTQCYYTIDDGVVQMRDGYIDFGQLRLRDKYGDTALVEGQLQHTGFKDMFFNFKATAPRFELLNTRDLDNKQFYGTARGSAKMSFTGPTWDMKMKIQAKATDSSYIELPLGESQGGGNVDYIKWKQYGKELVEEARVNKQNALTIDLSLTATNLVNIVVVLDKINGDNIKARGNGTLNMVINPDGKFSMDGIYNIEEGNYDFSFKSFIKKPFELMRDRGNKIEWSGNPYDANIKIDARYTASNVSTSGLSSSQNNVNVGARYKGDVYVVAKLTEKMLKPKIEFDIEFPQQSELQDPELQRIVKQIKADASELNKQVAYLVAFDQFAPLGVGNNPNYGTDLANLSVNTITGKIAAYLTDQVSDLLRRFFNDPSLKVNISSAFYNGNFFYNSNEKRLEFLRNNTKFELSRSYLNERLIITFDKDFDFGFLNRDAAYRVRYPLFPNYSVEYLIRPDGKVRATIFRQTSIDFTASDRTRTRYGTSLSFRREFNKLGDLFRRKEKKKSLKP